MMTINNRNPNPNPLFLLLLLITVLLFCPTPSLAISETSLEAAISALRSNGYTLFGNAILTSDLYSDLLSANTSGSSSFFTLFAPTDPSLFTLDISTRADLYVSSLRRHVAIGRLQSLSPPFPESLPSLLPDYPVSLSVINGSGIVTANGVVITAPRIFDGPDLTVHGLAGMLPIRFAYPPSFAPILTSPPSIAPSLSSPPPFPATSTSPPSISPAATYPPSISATPTPQPLISPTPSPLPSSDRAAEAPMGPFDQISMPPSTTRMPLDDGLVPSPMVLRNGEEWWCLTGEIEEAGCFKVSSALGLSNADPPSMAEIQGAI